MIKFNTKLNNKHLFSLIANNVHKFSVTAFGATIIYVLQIMNKSRMVSSQYLGIGVNAKIKACDNAIVNDHAKIFAISKFRATPNIYFCNQNMSVNIAYTTPLTWDNLIVRYDTWADVVGRFDTWDDVKTYR